MSLAEPCILVVDDEPQIRRLLQICLKAQGYQVMEAADATSGLAQAALGQADLVILDLGLPDRDGMQLLSDLRQWSQVPVLVLSVRASEAEKVALLDLGANDYMTKPFGVEELLARLRALLRSQGGQALNPPVFEAEGLHIDFAYRLVTLHGEAVSLTRKEYGVLMMLARHPGRIVTQQQLLKEVWGPSHVDDTHYLRIVVGHLRQKLKDDPAAPRRLKTEAGVGYRLLLPGSAR